MNGLFFPNRAQAGLTMTLGSWETLLPRTNVLTMETTIVARTTDADPDNTKFCVDFGKDRLIKNVDLVNVNFSDDAQVKIQIGTTAGGGEVYDGPLEDWLHIAGEDLDFEAAGTVPDENLRDWRPAIFVFPQGYTGRYLTVSIVDEDNEDEYIQIGRLFAGGGILSDRVTYDGFKPGWTDLSGVDTADLGGTWAIARRRLHTQNLVLKANTEAQFIELHEYQRILGIVDEVFWVPRAADKSYRQRFGFLARNRELSPADYLAKHYNLGLGLTERI